MRVTAAVALVLTVVGCAKTGVGSGASEPVKSPTIGTVEKPTEKPFEAKPERPAAVKPGIFPPDDWTHKELAEYLAQKGEPVTVRSLPLLSRQGRTTAAFDPAGNGARMVIVVLCADAKGAREEAGAMGEGAFTRGRFVFGLPATITDQDKARCRELLDRMERLTK